jgi:hypothetical protein
VIQFLKMLEVGNEWWESTKRRWGTVLAVYGTVGHCPEITGWCYIASLDRSMQEIGPSILYHLADIGGLIDPRERSIIRPMLDAQLAYFAFNAGTSIANGIANGPYPSRCGTSNERLTIHACQHVPSPGDAVIQTILRCAP